MKRSSFLKRIIASLLALFIPVPSSASNQKKRYFLTKFYIAGYYYYDGETVIDQLKPGDELIIVLEPSNPHDKRALEIYTKNNVKLGYVPREINPIPSRLLRQDVKITSTVDKINLTADEWRKVKVNLYAEV